MQVQTKHYHFCHLSTGYWLLEKQLSSGNGSVECVKKRTARNALKIMAPLPLNRLKKLRLRAFYKIRSRPSLGPFVTVQGRGQSEGRNDICVFLHVWHHEQSIWRLLLG